MNTVVSSLYTASLTLCLFSAGLVGRRRMLQVSWLTIFLVVESGNYACELLMAHPAVPLKGLWLGLRLAGSLLIAPALWLAVREAGGNRARLGDLGRRHLVAVAAGFALTLPLIQDAHLGVTYEHPDRPISWLHARFIHATMLGCIGIFAVQVPVLLSRCRRFLLENRGALAPAWLNYLLPMVATTWALGILRTVQCATHAPQELNVVFAFGEVGVTVGAVFVLLRRSEPAPVPAAPASSAIPGPAAPVEKYARSCLPATARERIRRKLETALARDDVLADSLLNLRSLSRTLNEKAHSVSQVINQDYRCTFYELVARHRVARAQRLLRERPGATVLEIALEVGFNSKSTFNTAFRRLTNTTPTEFRETARNPPPVSG